MADFRGELNSYSVFFNRATIYIVFSRRALMRRLLYQGSQQAPAAVAVHSG